ncbi:MAG: cupredoxin domain-containing protein [Methylocystis sp.]
MIALSPRLLLRAALPVAFISLGGSTFCFAAEARSPATSSPTADELRIVSKEFAFSVPPTRVLAGRSVTIVLDNSQGETEHRLAFPALGLRLSANAGGVARRVYTFKRPGEYEFVCDLPGHLEAGMKGKLTVGPREGGLKK